MQQITSCFFLLTLHLVAYTQIDIFYDVDRYVLTDQQQEAIISFLDTFNLDQTYQIYIKGFADASGTTEANLLLSQRRADQVTQFLKANYPGLIDSISFVGMGEVPSGISERRQHRKVNIQLESTAPGQPIEQKLPFGEPKVGYTFELKNINFKLSKPILLRESYPHLKQLFLWLKKYPNVIIEVQGHVCCSTDADVEAEKAGIRTFGMILSKERAKIICEILQKSGIDGNRLKYKGFGFTQPKHYPELSNEDRKGNRRVEVKVLKILPN